MSETTKLAALLAPLTTDQFVGHYQRREYLHLSRKPESCDEAVTVQDLDTLFQMQRLPVTMFEVCRSGVMLPMEEWSRIAGPSHRPERFALTERLLDLFGEGATVIVNGAHHSIPRLARTCRRLTAEMGLDVRANVYMTPPGAQGFSRHSDEHEVIVVQIHGSKSWRLFPQSGAPVPIEMKEGDLLYVPCGLAHEAEAQKDASIHVTLGLVPIYGYQLIEELATLARTIPAFQQPVGAVFGPLRGVGLTEMEFTGRLNALMREVPVHVLLERRRIESIRNQVPGWGGRLIDVIELQGLSLETVVCRRADLTVRTVTEGSSVTVHFAGRTVTVPLFLQQVLQELLGSDPITIRNLHGLISDEGRIEIARDFVRAGLLTIIRS
jgi:hypothetical protein